MEAVGVMKSVELFFSRYPEVKAKKGGMILQPEDHLISVYYLQSGFVRMYSILADGKELTLNIFKSGSFFPLFLIFAEADNSYFFQTLTACVLRKASKESVLEFVKKNPLVLSDFTKRISIGFHGLLSVLPYQLSGSVKRKMASTLIILARRFGRRSESGVQILLPLTHQDIANLTGVARETASLELEKLREQTIISYSRRMITVKDIEALETETLIEEETQSMGSDI